jgi:4-hydroxy-tetrahydrodipicolinate reductase
MVATPAKEPIRVVQWATGTVGASAMRAVISHPDLKLVGVRVYSEAKDGRDAGELCGLPATGVKATRDVEAILALKPDCVVYMPESTDLNDLCRLLENGANIVSTRAEFFNPAKMDPAARERVDAACRRGGSSIHSTGSSPGFVTEALPVVLTSLARHLDLLLIDEFANCIDGCSEEMLLNIMGFGETPEVFSRRKHADRDRVFEDSLSLLGDALGKPIERFELTSEFALARQPTKLHEVTIQTGTVGGQRVVVTGLHQGKPLLRFRCNWFVTADLEPHWDLRADGWRILVEGDTPLDIAIGFPIPAGERQLTLPRLTAHRPVNAIPYVCAAPPGIVTTMDLPQVIARLA